MRDLPHICPVLYLIIFHDFSIKDQWVLNLGLLLLGGKCHFGFLLFVSIILSSLSVTAHSIVHPSNSVTLCWLTFFPHFLPILPLPFPRFLLPRHPWTYSFHWHFVLAWEGYKTWLIAPFLLCSALLRSSWKEICRHAPAHGHRLTRGQCLESESETSE